MQAVPIPQQSGATDGQGADNISNSDAQSTTSLNSDWLELFEMEEQEGPSSMEGQQASSSTQEQQESSSPVVTVLIDGDGAPVSTHAHCSICLLTE